VLADRNEPLAVVDVDLLVALEQLGLVIARANLAELVAGGVGV